MRTLFICAESFRNRHLDEEYDEIVYIDDCPDQSNIDNNMRKIQDTIRRLDFEDDKSRSTPRGVAVTLDGPSVIFELLKGIGFKERENINVVFPQAYKP